MTKNMGNADRAIRTVIGVVLILAFFLGWVAGWVAWLALVVGIVFLATSAVSICPLYSMLGMRTCPRAD